LNSWCRSKEAAEWFACHSVPRLCHVLPCVAACFFESLRVGLFVGWALEGSNLGPFPCVENTCLPPLCMKFISTLSNFFSVSMPERMEEMSKWGLIYKGYSLTLNQRVQGSSPCAPTTVKSVTFCIFWRFGPDPKKHRAQVYAQILTSPRRSVSLADHGKAVDFVRPRTETENRNPSLSR
jgi:hypothetical protein